MAVSPTGHDPAIWWTTAVQDRLEAMKADFDAATGNWAGTLYGHIKTVADRPGGGSYFDYGAYPAFIYQTTGDEAYAALAWAKVTEDGSGVNLSVDKASGNPHNIFTRTGAGLGGNWAREHGVEHVLIYAVLYPWLVANGHQEEFLTALNNVATWLVNNETTPTQDSDQGTGKWMMVRTLYQATKDHNPTIVTLMADADFGPAIATGANYATFRNAIKYWTTVAAEGGEWCESSEYNTGTARILTLGAECLNVTEDAGAFDDIYDLIPHLAMRQIMTPTPDLDNSFQWGDEQEPRKFEDQGTLYKWIATAMSLTGAMTDDDPERGWLMRSLTNMVDTYGPLSPTGHIAYSLSIWNHDPYATVAADLSDVPRGWHAAGQGIGIVQTDIEDPESTAYWYHFPTGLRQIDHIELLNYWGDLQIYRKGEFALTHPIAYSSLAVAWGEGGGFHFDMVNSTAVEAFGTLAPGYVNNQDVLQFRRVQEHRFGTDYTSVIGTQGGMVHPPSDIDGSPSNYFDPPPAFCHEFSRRIVCLETADDSAVTAIVIERINAANPQDIAKFTRYRTANPNFQAMIQSYPRWKSYLHMPEEPTISDGVSTWQTTGGQELKDEWLLPAPADITITARDETTITNYHCDVAEKKWRTEVVPAVAETQWNLLVRVVSARDAAETHASTLLTGTADSYGVLVTRSGVDDRVVIFNGEESDGSLIGTFPTQAQCEAALDGVHLRVNAFTIEWTQTTASGKVLIHDLDPEESWSYSLDGGMSTALTITDGVAELTVADADDHELLVTTGVAEPPPDPAPARKWHQALPVPYVGASALVFGPAAWRWRRMRQKSLKEGA